MKYAMIPMALLLCAAFAQMAHAQQPPSPTGTSNKTDQSANREGAITGRVIGADGQPITYAEVFADRIGERFGSGQLAATDGEGNFKLTGLSPASYILFARAPGYVEAESPLEKNVHHIGESVTISLVKGGVITGQVTDETGEPIAGVTVKPHCLRDLEGKPSGPGREWFNITVGVTDDRGIYRVYGLRPGVYIVGIGVGPEYGFEFTQIRRDAPTYYPSATRDTAIEINLRSGEEISGIDIRHRGERGQIVSGSISAASGQIESSSPQNSVSVRLKSVESERFESETSAFGARVFAFFGVPDGDYDLIATRTNDNAETSDSARRRISVKGSDVGGVELKLSPRGSIAGRVVIQSSTQEKRCAIKDDPHGNQTSSRIQGPGPVVQEIILRADLDDPNPRAEISRFLSLGRYERPPNKNGEFAMKSLEAGRYRITANLPDGGWRVRAITQPGQSGAGTAKPAAGAARSAVDAARNGIAIKPGEKLSGVEVIVAEDAATLNGRVVPSKDGMKLPSSLRVHLVPAEAPSADEVIRYAETAVRGDGSFEFKHIAPGKYLLHARRIAENIVNDDQIRPAAWDDVERAKLRREALRREALSLKNEIELQPCGRVKDYIVRFNP
ncbi:MAG TPA: carboxypeptidase-like regulatory domain-containing protein [Blastocatellia bacterium]|nr:carboxypeptidase-like regulatory domain-containing protein [Blastocatellia bacterium]